MKIVKARKEHGCDLERCSIASKTIGKGEFYCSATLIVRDNHKITSRSMHYHWGCWEHLKLSEIDKQRRVHTILVKEDEERLDKKRMSKESRGRPRKYTDTLRARNLLSLRHYHRKVGNGDRVFELGVELDRLRLEMEE